MSERRAVRCDGHGEAWETYVCEHLVKKPKQAWHGDYPEEGNPWPDAWCRKCNEAYEREGGEWNERNESEARIKLICSACYVERRMASVAGLAGRQKRRWENFVAEACVEQDARQERMVADLGLERYPGISLDMYTATLEFGGEGLRPLATRIEAIGSFSSVSDTWLWAWCNWHLPEVARSRVVAVRELGEREGFPHLTEPKWHATEHDGWHMAAIAARELAALGIYRIPDEQVSTFVAIVHAKP